MFFPGERWDLGREDSPTPPSLLRPLLGRAALMEGAEEAREGGKGDAREREMGLRRRKGGREGGREGKKREEIEGRIELANVYLRVILYKK